LEYPTVESKMAADVTGAAERKQFIAVFLG
jgi:hypothetical protein